MEMIFAHTQGSSLHLSANVAGSPAGFGSLSAGGSAEPPLPCFRQLSPPLPPTDVWQLPPPPLLELPFSPSFFLGGPRQLPPPALLEALELPPPPLCPLLSLPSINLWPLLPPLLPEPSVLLLLPGPFFRSSHLAPFSSPPT